MCMCCYSRILVYVLLCFFFQAEDGIRDLVRSRGLGDVYKRQEQDLVVLDQLAVFDADLVYASHDPCPDWVEQLHHLSLIHI